MRSSFLSLALASVFVSLGCAHAPAVPSAPTARAAVPFPIATPCADVAECTLACDGGDADACVRAADSWERASLGTIKQLMRIPAYARACRDGSARGCYELGSEYLSEDPLPKNIERAAQLMRPGCEKHPEVCSDATAMLTEKKADPNEVQWFAARAGDHAANLCASRDIREVQTGIWSFHGLSERGQVNDPALTRARGTLEASCHAGRPWACMAAAALWSSSLSPGGDAARAKALATEAGQLLAKGCTTATDKKECELPGLQLPIVGEEEWARLVETALETACATGDKKSCASLHSARLIEACSQRKDGAACLELGRLEEDGARTSPEPDEDALRGAALFYSQACDLENGEGCARAADLLEAGHGPDELPPSAIDVFRTLACRHGFTAACGKSSSSPKQ
ncbi:hypothetical protein DAT35_08365 [Vitiosangium sp. GDMCC 1.1324]|nr:hypothetical protein DAT35_08365 [Vitiosangium sp. GDMCC 1.1324]